MAKIGLHFGALSPSISKQLKEQKVTCKRVYTFQKLADAITLLHIHSFINESSTDMARKKLMNAIAKESISKP